ncbi:hypothetical protein CHS0354_014456 [Potamilus streckersoni]|uniref:Uncharacterized protein n=1 Tax=Potamilus streckersoni TaxID=2493646 RepID=A0AAE0VS19_9BIVA|nr:hypothetical protein CHS0354_014456 [Potamilus streckersoni]
MGEVLVEREKYDLQQTPVGKWRVYSLVWQFSLSAGSRIAVKEYLISYPLSAMSVTRNSPHRGEWSNIRNSISINMNATFAARDCPQG